MLFYPPKHPQRKEKRKVIKKKTKQATVHIDSGRSILLLLLLASLTCFMILRHTNIRIAEKIERNVSRMYLKYKETAEKTTNASMKSSPITNTASTLHQEEKRNQVSPLLIYNRCLGWRNWRRRRRRLLVLGSNLVLPKLLRQIRTRDHLSTKITTFEFDRIDWFVVQSPKKI